MFVPKTIGDSGLGGVGRLRHSRRSAGLVWLQVSQLALRLVTGGMYLASILEQAGIVVGPQADDRSEVMPATWRGSQRPLERPALCMMPAIDIARVST
jgi:hypothetical protein